MGAAFFFGMMRSLLISLFRLWRTGSLETPESNLPSEDSPAERESKPDPFAGDRWLTEGDAVGSAEIAVANSDQDALLKSQPIGIIHLLSLITGVSIAVAASQASTGGSFAFDDPTDNESFLVINTIRALLAGVMIAGLHWLYLNYRCSGRYCLQPGHYVVALLGVSAVFVSCLELFVSAGHFVLSGWIGLASYIPQFAISRKAYKRYRKKRGYRIWATIFFSWMVMVATTMLIGIAAQLFFSEEMISAPSFGLAMGILILVSAIIGIAALLITVLLFSRIAERNRDWIHRTGIAVYFGFILVEIASTIWLIYLTQFTGSDG